MEELIKGLKLQLEAFEIKDAATLEQFRIKFLGAKNEIKALFKTPNFSAVPGQDRKVVGQALNALSKAAQEKFDSFNDSYATEEESHEKVDISRPAEKENLGSRHPLSLVKNQIVEIFSKIGFTVSEGPEIEDDWHNFTALNLPEEHPARDMQDTFFIQQNPDVLLRTHTSSVQVRHMEKTQPPIRAIFPGRVYRNEAISARAHCFFHQIEGLYIAEKVSFADLKQTLLYFAQSFFGDKAEIRLRPSYFPFTEPSAEVDVSCSICGGKGCNVCKYTGWLEIMGCGMIDPAVLVNCGIDSEKYTGFAFGMGVERIAMLKYGVKDLRLFSENDIRFLRQFEGVVE